MIQQDPYARRRAELAGQQQVPHQGGSTLRGVVRSGLQGLTFGFADELAGLIGMDPEEIRRRDEAFRREHPLLAFGSEIAGGVAPLAVTAITPGGQGAAAAQAGRLAGSAGRFARAMPTVTKAMTATGRAAAAHPYKSMAVQGALSGAGVTEGGLKERAGGAALGGVLGTGIGSGVKYLGNRGVAGIRALTPQNRQGALSRLSGGLIEEPGERAARLVRGTLGQDAVDPARIASAEADFYPNTLLHAANGETANLAEAASRQGSMRPGEGAHAQFQRSLLGRMNDAPEFGRGVMEDAMGVGKINRPQLAAQLKADKINRARPLYKAAHAIGRVEDEQITRLVQRHPELQEAYEAGRRLARLGDEIEIPPLFDADGNMQMTVAGIDYMEQGAREVGKAMAESRGGQGFTPRMGSYLKRQARAATDRLRKLHPEFDEARRVYSGDAAVEDAFEDGFGMLALDTDPDEIAMRMVDMADDERELFRLGAAQRIYKEINKRREGTPMQIPTILGNKQRIGQIRAIFGDEAAERMEQLVERITRNQGLAQQVVGGSRTAFRQGQEDLGGEVMSLGTGSLGKRALNAIGGVLGVGDERFGRATADEIAGILTQTPEAGFNQVQALLHPTTLPGGRFGSVLRPTRNLWPAAIGAQQTRAWMRD